MCCGRTWPAFGGQAEAGGKPKSSVEHASWAGRVSRGWPCAATLADNILFS